MALKICLLKGEKFKVGRTEILVAEIKGPEACVLEIRGALIRRYHIDQHQNEILPNVRINCGKSDRPHRTWLTIDAPRDVRIERMQHDAARFDDGEPPEAA